MSDTPAELKYTATHEWVRAEDDGAVTIGITDHAQALLGDLVFVEAPEVGASYAARDACAVVESVKAASDVYAPVSGEVIAVNESLTDNPELINEDPFGEGWIYRLRPENMDDLDGLMSADEYLAQLGDED